MQKHGKILEKILRGESDANIRFPDMRMVLHHLGFSERMRGSHHSFRRSGIAEKINIQHSGKLVKPYQVKQVRAIIRKYRLQVNCHV